MGHLLKWLSDRTLEGFEIKSEWLIPEGMDYRVI
jgi:hypothetical protein